MLNVRLTDTIQNIIIRQKKKKKKVTDITEYVTKSKWKWASPLCPNER